MCLVNMQHAVSADGLQYYGLPSPSVGLLITITQVTVYLFSITKVTRPVMQYKN